MSDKFFNIFELERAGNPQLNSKFFVKNIYDLICRFRQFKKDIFLGFPLA